MNPEFRNSLIRKLGTEKVKDDPESLKEFARDISENPEGKPDLVVFAEVTEDVRTVLMEANQQGIPVVPVMGNSNLGGLAIPQYGGIVLSLSRMNRILEINEADQYAVIEPGVTWQDMSDHLDQNHPNMRFAYPLAPPDTGVLPNCIMDGLANLSLRHGSASHWINALEVVLPSGEVLRTGHYVYDGLPCTSAPFPLLHGLLVGFQGTTGVVTRMAVQLWPRRKYRRRSFMLAYDAKDAFDLVNRLSREDLMDDLGSLSAPSGKMLFGEYRPMYKDPNEPLLFFYMDYSSNFESDFQSKHQIVEQLVNEARAKGARFDGPLDLKELVRLEPRFSKFASFPTRLDFLLDHKGGGLTWIGTYGPTSKFAEGFVRGSEIMAKHNLPPVIVARPMQGGHFGVLRWIAVFDRDDPEDTKRVFELNKDLADLAVDMGFFPYKTPQWAWERYADRLDPTFRRLVHDVKKLMDPKGILNPGHLAIPRSAKVSE